MTTKKIKGQYRQGDVLLNPTEDEFPTEQAKVITHSKELIALAYGETSGHAHTVAVKDATMYEWQGDRLLINEVETPLKHGNPGNEEATKDHDFIKVKPGKRSVIQQTQYTPAEIINVAD